MFSIFVNWEIMADIVSRQKRSENMSAIKNKDTKPEVYFRKKLFAFGLRYRKNSLAVFGCPDIFFPRYNTAVFVNGCYWHRHKGCKYAYTPKSRIDFWSAKFESNIKRDARVREELLMQKIKCLVVWECTIKRMKKNVSFEEDVIRHVLDFLKSSNLYQEL